ncbi:peptidase inhibitor family I36 protein [Streptomyces prasinus]
MSKRIGTTVLVTAIAAMLTANVSSSAYAAPSCTSKICTWTGANYTGTKRTSGLGAGVCYHSGRIRSIENRDSVQVRYYPNDSCSGAPYHESSWSFTDIDAQTGWKVYSYKKV